MEIYLKSKEADKETILRLPVLPSEFERLTSASFNESKIIGLGEVATFGVNGLSRITLSSFFPAKKYTFNQYPNIQKPYDSIGILKNWKNKGIVVRLIMTGTDINQEMMITDLNYGEQDSTGDVYYTINLVEHRNVTIPKIDTKKPTNQDNKTDRPTDNKNNTTTTQKTHKVVKGDCLWDIAHRFYGKGKDYPKIKNANSTKYPSLKKNNIIYVGWELVIP